MIGGVFGLLSGFEGEFGEREGEGEGEGEGGRRGKKKFLPRKVVH